MASSSAASGEVVGLLAAGIAGTDGVGLALVAGGQGYTYFEELQAISDTAESPLAPKVLAAIATALSEEIGSPEGLAAGCW